LTNHQLRVGVLFTNARRPVARVVARCSISFVAGY
jgi:hypothetical protein